MADSKTALQPVLCNDSTVSGYCENAGLVERPATGSLFMPLIIDVSWGKMYLISHEQSDCL